MREAFIKAVNFEMRFGAREDMRAELREVWTEAIEKLEELLRSTQHDDTV